jgi:enamine deaminase RidA (YjgF/YER057c/UK114 family)
MRVEQIRVDPDPYEPFRLSQGFRVGDLLFISGQAAIDEQGQIVGADDFDAQAEQAFRNLRRVLEAAARRSSGSSRSRSSSPTWATSRRSWT